MSEADDSKQPAKPIEVVAGQFAIVALVIETVKAPNDGRKAKAQRLAAVWFEQVGSRTPGWEPGRAAADLADHFRGLLPGTEIERLGMAMEKVLRGLQARKHPHSTTRPHRPGVVADPVEHARGEYVHEATDLVVRGAGLDFAFQRTYRHQTIYDGPLGHRWDHGYNLFLRVDDLEATVWVGGGRSEEYRRHGAWGTAGCNYYVPPDGVDATLEPIGVPDAPEGWARRSPDGLRHVFEPDPGWSGAFRLARIEDRWGNHLRFTYVVRPSGQARLDRVHVNHDERWVQLAYDELDRIIRVADHTGRTWRYRYDTHGDLIAVTTPATPDQPRGATTTYRYSSDERTGPLAHLLTDIFDAEGRHYLHTTYGTDPGEGGYNRVVRQRLGTGEYAFRYETIDSPDLGLAEEDRPTTRCWVRERNGSTALYVYNGWGGLLWKQETDKGPGHAPRRAVWRYRYDRSGVLVASRTPEGVIRQQLTGREHYLRVTGLARDSDAAGRLWDRPDLTADVRRGFGRVLATVDRAARHPEGTIGWADRFGDVYVVAPDDLVVKRTYEGAYGQPLTVSDPRATTASDPRAAEPAEHHRLLTRYEYGGPPGDPTRELVLTILPTPTLPDGTPAGAVVHEIVARDARGRITRTRDPVGVETVTEYQPDAAGPRAGFVRSVTLDPGDRAAGHLAIKTEQEVDELGRVIATTLPRGVESADGRFVITQTYDPLDRVISARRATPLATETRTSYEAAGMVQRVETDWVSPLGGGGRMVQRFVYDEEQRVREAYRGGEDVGAQRRTAHRYNAAGLRTVTVAENDTATLWQYDARDQVARVIHGPGVDEAIEELVRDRDGRVIEHRSPEGRVTRTEHDGFGRVVQVTDPLGHVTRTSYDRAGRPTVVRHFERRAPAGEPETFVLLARTETVYDELGREVRTIASRFDDPPPAVSRAELATAYLSGHGAPVESQRFHDAASRLVRVVDPLGNATTSEYDAAGRVTRVIDATGNRIDTSYDAHGNPVRVDRVDVVRDRTGVEVGRQAFTTLATYDERDRRLTATDSLGNVTTHVYDSLDREVRTVDPLGNVREQVYDVFGDLTLTRALETSTGDGSGAALPPQEVRFEHDRAGLVTARIDPLGRRTELRRDKHNRVVEELLPDGSRLVTRYDRDSLVTAVRDAHGVVVRTQHDAAGRPRRIDVDTSEVDANVEIQGTRLVEHEYDGLGRPRWSHNEVATIERRIDSLGRVLGETSAVFDGATTTTLQLARAFDDLGRTLGLTYPGGRVLEHDRDPAGRLRAIRHLADGGGYPGTAAFPRTIATYAYAGDRVTAIDFANGTSAGLVHDARGGVVEVHHQGPAGTVLRVQQLRDGARAPRVRRDQQGASVSFERFGYDSRYQLTARADAAPPAPFDLAPLAPPAAPPVGVPAPRQPTVDALIGGRLGPSAPAGADAWTYDLTGNRAQTTLSGAVVGYQVDVRDRYSAVGGTAPSYDRAGNLGSDGVHDFVYDGLRRLVRVRLAGTGTDVVRYAYDPEGRRVVEDRPGAAPLVIAYDGIDRIADHRGGACVAQYVHGPAIDDPVELAAGGAHHTYHTDLQGSVRALTTATGAVAASYRFDPFGVLVASTGPALGPAGAGAPAATQPFGYGGRPFEAATGHYDQRARVYVPSFGRFLQRDPAGAVDAHLYTFAGNHPLAFGDPSGLSRQERSIYGRAWDFLGRIPAALDEHAYHEAHTTSTRGGATLRNLAAAKGFGGLGLDYDRLMEGVDPKDAKSMLGHVEQAAIAGGRKIYTSRLPRVVVGGLTAAVALGDTATLGGSRLLRHGLSLGDAVDESSAAYRHAHTAAEIGSAALAVGQLGLAWRALRAARAARILGTLGEAAGGVGTTTGTISRAAATSDGLSAAAGSAAPTHRLVVGGGRAAGFPALAEGDVSLNILSAAKPHVVGDIASAPFADASFGSVYFERVPFFAFTGKNAVALQETARILAPGGTLLIETGSAAPISQVVASLEAAGFEQVAVNIERIVSIGAKLGAR